MQIMCACGRFHCAIMYLTKLKPGSGNDTPGMAHAVRVRGTRDYKELRPPAQLYVWAVFVNNLDNTKVKRNSNDPRSVLPLTEKSMGK